MRYHVRFICCGFLEAERDYSTWERANEARRDWVDHGIIDDQTWWVGTDPSGHQRAAIVE